MNGGISLQELEDMPYSQYKCLRKAAELIEIQKRILFISDFNAAQYDPKNQVTNLQKEYTKICGGSALIDLENPKVDANWESRLKSFAR